MANKYWSLKKQIILLACIVLIGGIVAQASDFHFSRKQQNLNLDADHFVHYLADIQRLRATVTANNQAGGASVSGQYLRCNFRS